MRLAIISDTHLMALGDEQRTRLRALVAGEWANVGPTSTDIRVLAATEQAPEEDENPAVAGLSNTRLAGFEPAASCSGGKRSIH